ncbi:hypothetical protein Cgig2_006980 [Carnegiea gigantea]|uniref:Uncharacterized protein n=1 Tax=Carnegiea gigantea TaxID=171969 RepID=A0A9Q1QGY8_9CARY|nr:hypothetical protein Cgig2_006980 [Carnegiea gigantea]
MEEISAAMLSKEDMKNFEQLQKLIDAGQVEKLKVEQCKVYLRKHGLRLTGKKDILIQRIKEHVKILNGEGEKKYPPSSFVLNCKGDACMGDIVMFEQTVYEGFFMICVLFSDVAFLSSWPHLCACGPPCGKRIVAGRIAKESYGAAKQQHTFTRWEDEAERQRVLNEKHRRGSIARSNRDARIQKKEAKKMIKGRRGFPKKCQSSRQQKNMKHEPEHIAQQQQIVQEPNPKFRAEFKENFYHQPSPSHKSDIPAYTTQSSYPLCIGHPTNQLGKPAGSSHGSHRGYLENCFNGNAIYPDKFLQTQQDPRGPLLGEYKENLFPKPCLSGYTNMASYGQGNSTLSDGPQPLIDSNCCQSSCQQKNIKHEPEHIAQQQPIVQGSNPKFRAEFKENFYHQPPPKHKSDIPAYTAQSSYPFCIGHSTNQLGKPAVSSHGSHCGYLENCFNGNAMSSDKFLQTQWDPRGQLFGEYKENLFPKSYSSGYRNRATDGQGNLTLSDRPQSLIDSNWGISYERHHQRPSNPQQNLCRYYPQGRCHCGNQCKFLHELDRTNANSCKKW